MAYNFPPEDQPQAESGRGIEIPVTENVDEAWCDMFNMAYGEMGYRTNIFSGMYLRQCLGADGEPLEDDTYDSLAFVDDEGYMDDRYVAGTVNRIKMRIGPNSHEVPVAELQYPFDSENGMPLVSHPRQHILVPLTRVDKIILK